MLGGPGPFWKWSTKIDRLNLHLWVNVWPRSRRRARSRYARGGAFITQAPAPAMRFIYEPNKPEQNILCGRLQSVLLWLEMKLKNVSEASQRNTFVTFFLSFRVKCCGVCVSGLFFLRWRQLRRTGWNEALLLKISRFAWTFFHLWGICGYCSQVCGRFDVVFSRKPSQNSPVTTFNQCVTHTLMKELR